METFPLKIMSLYRNKKTGKLMRLEAAHWDDNPRLGSVHLIPDEKDWSGCLDEFFEEFEPV
jgi:hypothetical protein